MSHSPSMFVDVDEEHETDSITSTIEEEPDSDQEWLVNDILAEGKDATGTTKYLIDWQGYPLYDASWEPNENLGDTMLADWEESKKKEGHQRKSNNSINAWYKAVIARLHGKIARHDERNRRREELGLDVSIYEKSLEDCLEDLKKHPKAQVMEDEKTTASRSNKNQPRIQREPSGNVTQRQYGAYEDQVLKTIRPKPPTRGFSDPDVAKTRSGAAAGVHRVVHKPMTKTSLMSKLGSRKCTGPPKEQNSGTTSLPSVARGASSGNSSNVFVGGTTRKKKGTLLDAATDPNKAPQFLKSRLINKIQKGLRDKEGTVTPAKQPLSVFNLNPAERQRVDQKVRFGRDSIASSTQEDMQTEDPPHQPNSDEHTMRESEKGPSTVEKKKKKKKKKKSVRWGDSPEVPPQTNPGSESSLFIESLTASPEIEQQTVQPKEENGEQSTTILNLLPTASMMTASPPPVEGDFCPSIQTITRRAKFGPSATASIPLTFEGPSGENMHPWLSMLAGPEPLTFTHTCIAQDFWSQAASKPLFRGIVTSCDNLASLTSTSERLKLGSFGVLCHLGELCIVLHPSQCETWQFPTQPVPTQSHDTTLLKFIIFEATGFLEASSLAPIPLSLDHGNEDFPPGMPLALFRRIFGIEYARALPERLQNTTRHSFFLAFPRSATVDAMFLARWLRICNSDCQIYSSHFPGHWQYFMNIEAGVVIIDEDAAHSIRKFPHINHLLSTNPERFTFWVFTKSLRTLTLLPHESNSFAEIGAIRLQSALEFGTAILVPPSFLVSQPRQALVLFRWLWQSNVKASIDRYRRARVVVCARIDEWLFELAVESSKRTPSQPSTRGQIHIPGAAQHSQAIEAMFQTWKFVKKLIDEPIDPSPLIFAPEFIDGNDEQSLVNWFGWWSSMNMGQFRRFIVLGTETESARLSRRIKRPRFLPSTTNSPDEMHLHHDREEHLKHLTSLHGKIAQPIVLDQSRMSLDNQSRVLVNAIDAVIRNAHRRCPLEIFKFPVSYWDGDMAYHFGDYKSLFATYSKCSNWHHPFDALSHPVRNTMTALFYTIEGPWDVNLYPGGKMPTRRSWLVMHRPVNVSRRPWRASELLIWDPTPNEKFSLGDVYEDDLIEAQREMIRFFHQQNSAKNPDQPLKRVWIAGFDSSSIDSNADLLLEETLFTLQKFVDDPRIWLPALDTDLPVRGWKLVKSGSAPTTLNPQSPPVDAMDIDEPEAAGAENGQTMVTIFHPPRCANVVPGSTKCCNRLYQCTIESYQQVRADVEHRMEYTFRPTQVWYREQLMEGRGFEHVEVSPWHATFNRFCLPTDME